MSSFLNILLYFKKLWILALLIVIITVPKHVFEKNSNKVDMMDKQQFYKQIVRLIDAYGEKHYSKERLKVLYAKYNHLTEIQFSDIVDKLLFECKTAPLGKEIEKHINTMPRTKVNKKFSVTCSFCQGTGSVSLVLRTNPLEKKCFRCSCSLGGPGIKLPDYVTRVNENVLKKYRYE